MTFDAHDFAVYSIQWRLNFFYSILFNLFLSDFFFDSPFHPNIFASCSADGTVKIWHEKISLVFYNVTNR